MKDALSRDIIGFILNTYGSFIRTGENSTRQCRVRVVENRFKALFSGASAGRFPRYLSAPSLPLSGVGGRSRRRPTRAGREGDVHRQASSEPGRLVAPALSFEWRNYQRTHSAGSGFLAQKEGVSWPQKATEALSQITSLTGSKHANFLWPSKLSFDLMHPVGPQ